MKSKVILGLLLVFVVGIVFGHTTVAKNAETSPPGPAAIIFYQ